MSFTMFYSVKDGKKLLGVPDTYSQALDIARKYFNENKGCKFLLVQLVKDYGGYVYTKDYKFSRKVLKL